MLKIILKLFRYKDEKLFRLANYDYVTDLPNRLSFFNDMEKITSRTDRTRTNFAILFLDIDNFKQVNDTMGHEVGDELLKIIAGRLTVVIRKSDSVYRMGGDEFIIISENIPNPKGVAILAQKIIDVVSEKITINLTDITISASVGICFYPTDGDTIKDAVRKADIAMYVAKERGGNAFQFYTHKIHEKVMEKMNIESHIKNDLYYNGKKGFRVLYQPHINIKSGKIVGVEALVRWTDPEYGTIDTDKFISICEESNLIIDVDRFVLQKACCDINTINSEFGSKLFVSVNFSPRYIYSKEVVRDVMKIIDKTYTKPNNVEIEITERTMMADMEIAATNIKELSKNGVRIAIDDFGVGASSLNYLRKFKVNKLKIDRMFIRDLMNNEDDKKIVNAIMSLAYNFNLECTAEGVETKEQLDFLKATGCDLVQGYYYSRPIPLNDLISLLKKGKERRRIIRTEEQVQILTKYCQDFT